LEFLQWIKKFWDQYYPGGDYSKNTAAAVKVKKVAVKTPAATAAAADRSSFSRPQKDLAQEYEKVTKDLTKQVEELKVKKLNQRFRMSKWKRKESFILESLERLKCTFRRELRGAPTTIW
jgi:hypothetical protein